MNARQRAAQRLDRRQDGVGLGAADHLGRGGPRDLEVELLLGREVVEQQPARDAGALRDQLDRQLVQAAGGQHLDAEVDELRPPRLGAEPRPLVAVVMTAAVARY